MYQTEQILILRCNNHGWQYFRVFAPFLWNNLPVCIGQTESIVNYKKRLKIHLFAKHFGKMLLFLHSGRYRRFTTVVETLTTVALLVEPDFYDGCVAQL